MPGVDARVQAAAIDLHPRYGLLALGYMAGIFVLSSIPDRGVGTTPVILQLGWNLLHVPVYAGLAFLFAQALAGGRIEGTLLWAPYRIALLATAAYAVSDEWHQSFVPGRYASAGDVLLDLTGGVGMLLVLRLRAGRQAG